MIDLIQLLDCIIKAMVTVEKMLTLDGEGKKNAVITYMKENFQMYEKYQHIIPVVIELVVIISLQKRIEVNLKKLAVFRFIN